MSTSRKKSTSSQSFLRKVWERLTQSLQDTAFIWWDEMKQAVKDEGVLIFFILVPLFYPLLYSWIYNNEVVREVPVVVVDDSHSQLSRQFVRLCDASPDVKFLSYAADLDEAKSLLSRQVARGIYYFPSDFESKVCRLEPAVVSVYCDMSLMLCYKAVFQTAQTVSMQMGADIQTRLGGHYTRREEQIAAQPLAFEEVPIFNPTGGYGSLIIPAVLMLIIQQTLVLGIGLSAGTARERNRYRNLIPISRHYNGMFGIVAGKSLAYFMIYAVITAYLVFIVPRLFGFTAIGRRYDRALSRERHAPHGLRHRAPAVPLRSRQLAPVQHTALLAGRQLALPQHLRHPGLHTHQRDGRHPRRCPPRVSGPVDSDLRLLHHRLHGLPLPDLPLPQGSPSATFRHQESILSTLSPLLTA